MSELTHVLNSILEGGELDRSAILTEYPEHAAELTQLFTEVDGIDDAIRCGVSVPAVFAFQGVRADGPVDVALQPDADMDIPGFVVEAKVYRGAQGVVYRARQLSTGRTVALKVRRLMSESARVYFEREIAAASKLRHPNIATIHDAGVAADGRPFLAMEYVDGAPLYIYLQKNPALTLTQRLELWMHVCEGVRHAHQHGVIHRDINPSNVLVDRANMPRLIDFGLATLQEHAEPHPGAQIGTPGYIPPEIRSGRIATADMRGDVYGLGMIGHDIVMGRTRREGESPCHADRDLTAILTRAVQADPDQRYQDVGALVEEIRQFIAGEPLTHRQRALLYVLRKRLWKRRRTVTLLIAIAASVAALVLVVRDRASLRQSEASSAQRRFDIIRRDDTQRLEGEYQPQMQLANIYAAILSIPLPDAPAYWARYHGATVDSTGLFEPFAEGAPPNVGAAIRSEGSAAFAEAVAWLDESSPRLDELAELLETTVIRFRLEKDTEVEGMEWGREPIEPACAVGDAFVARACLRFLRGEHDSAVRDLTAARRIAADIGDGVLVLHKLRSAQSQDRIYAGMQHILTRGLPNPGELLPYTRWMLSDPEVVTFEPALLSRRMALMELFNASLVSDSADTEEWFDLRRLDRFLYGYLTEKNAMRPANIARARAMDADDVHALIDRFITDTRTWESRPSAEIHEKVMALWDELAARRERESMLWIFDPPAWHFLAKRRTQSRRDALRIASAAIEHRAAQGAWPDTLDDLEAAGVSLRDGRTAASFSYEVADDGIVIVSEMSPDLTDARQRVIEWIRPSDGRLVYFPASTHQPNGDGNGE